MAFMDMPVGFNASSDKKNNSMIASIHTGKKTQGKHNQLNRTAILKHSEKNIASAEFAFERHDWHNKAKKWTLCRFLPFIVVLWFLLRKSRLFTLLHEIKTQKD